jgi:hypothetical protein
MANVEKFYWRGEAVTPETITPEIAFDVINHLHALGGKQQTLQSKLDSGH